MSSSIFTYIILSLLSLDTIRALVAMLGWVKPDYKYAWLFYGRYERNLMHTALRDLGFDEAKTDSILAKVKDVAKQITQKTGITKKEAPYHLIMLLAQYMVKFPEQIQYGGTSVATSSYYIDTMEISHNREDLFVLASIMSYLIGKELAKKPDIIIVPKGGNPLLAQAVANIFNAHLIVAKSGSDKSRIITGEDRDEDNFRINYEGSWKVLTSKSELTSIVLDCNTSGGSQILDIIKDLSQVIASSNLKIGRPDKAFVLFRADNLAENIDQKFADHQCRLIRFLDLDEDMKVELFRIKTECSQSDGKINYFIDNHKKQAVDFIARLKKKKKYYY